MNRIFGISLAFCALGTIAQASPEFVPLQERAQGQSLVGSSQLNDSLYSNPAAGAFSNAYTVDGTYLSSKSFAVSIFDTKTTATGGALGYFRETVPGSNDARQGAKLALLGRASQTLGFGIAGKMMWGPGSDGVNTKLNDIDTGVLTKLGALELGATVRNLLGGNEKYEAYREYAVGGRIGYNDTVFLSAAATAKWGKIKPYQYGVGAEYVSPFYFGIKGGYRMQPELGRNNWSAGASFNSPKFSLHYAIEFASLAGEKPEHSIGTTLQF